MPPDNIRNNYKNQLTKELFETLDHLKPFILVGDLNCHSKSWYCKNTSKKGSELEEFLYEHDLSIVNSSEPTYNSFSYDQSSILDLMIVSNDIVDKIDKFKVLSQDMTSDHFPIVGTFNFKTNYIKDPFLVYKKRIDWKKYTDNIDLSLRNNYGDDNSSLESIYSHFVEVINNSKTVSTTVTTRRINCKTVPKYLLDIIEYRKEIAKEIKKDKSNLSLKTKYNSLTKTIKKEFKAVRENMWTKFCESLDHTKKNSALYWNKIKQIGSMEYKLNRKNKDKIPELSKYGIIASNDEQKAQLFGKTLEKIFSDESSSLFDENHKIYIDNYLNINKNSLFITRQEDMKFDDDFSLSELECAVESLKKKSAPGSDGINNKNIINLSLLGKEFFLKIINKSWNSGDLLLDWKTAVVTMIKKKESDLSDPTNYRPISLTKCLGKLCEKMIKLRLIYFLDKHNLLSIYQSGFRSKRQTTDNLLFLSQKTLEAIDSGNYTCGVVFDIHKAFD